MKQAILSLFLLLTTFCSNRLMAQNSKYLTIDQLDIPLDATTIIDSSNGGRLSYFVYMAIAMRNQECFTALKNLYASLAENRQLNLSIKTVDMNGKAVEERFYQGAAVQEIIIPLLDGADKNLIKIQVKIRSAALSVKENTASVNTAGLARNSGAINSNFRLSLGALPVKRVARIGSIRITSGQLSSFFIELSEQDAKDWQNWLMSNASKRESGAIEWLGANFKDPLFQLDLRDIEITSTSTQYTNAETRAISRLNVGLRGRVVPGGGK
jgi:hypothetical protein